MPRCARVGCPDDEQLALHLAGELAPEEKASVAALLLECEVCRRLVGALAMAQTLTRSRHGSQVFPSARWRWAAGERVGYMTVLGPLGRGGMGEVYEAHDTRLDRNVAVKVVRSDGARDNERLLKEGRALAALNHPHVVRVFDVGLRGGAVYIVLARADGQTLRHWLRAERRSVRRVLDLFLGLAKGCAALHDKGLVHRDIKPANILVDGSGNAMLSDFGLVTISSRARAGTPGYVAPELEAGHPATPASDQFAFCVTLRDALASGQLRIPRRLRAVLERGTHREPGRRFASMRDLADAMRAPARPTMPLALLVGGGVLALSVFAARPERPAVCSLADTSWVSTEGRQPEWREYREAWRETAQRACELRSGPAVRACLESQRDDVLALFDASPGAERMVEGVWTALEPDQCLVAGADEEQQTQEIRSLVVRSIDLAKSGQIEQARELADRAYDLARDGTLRDRLLLSWNSAKLAWNAGDLAIARERYEAGYWLAFQLDEPTQTAINAIGVMEALVVEVDPDGARVWHRNAAAAASRLGRPNPGLLRRLESGAASIHLIRGELDDAVAASRRALQHAETQPGTVKLSGPVLSLAQLLMTAGHWEEALEYYERGLALAREDFGASSLMYGERLGFFAEVCANPMGDHERAVALYRESLQILERDGGSSIMAPWLHAGLARSLLETGRVEEARPVVEKALAGYVRQFPPEHPQQYTAYALRAQLASAEAASANTSFEEALELANEGALFAVRVTGAGSLHSAYMLEVQAGVAQDAGEWVLAKAKFKEALDIVEPLVGSDSSELGSVLLGYATALEALGETEAARETYDRVVSLHVPELLRRRAQAGVQRLR